MHFKMQMRFRVVVLFLLNLFVWLFKLLQALWTGALFFFLNSFSFFKFFFFLALGNGLFTFLWAWSMFDPHFSDSGTSSSFYYV